jgi:hypothetical protein
MPEVLDFRWPEIQRGGQTKVAIRAGHVRGAVVHLCSRVGESQRKRPGAGPAAREVRAHPQLVCDIASCAATRRCSCRNSRLTSHVPGSVLRSRRYLLFCWLLCRTSNSLKQITKAGVLRLPCFRCATSACGSFFLGPVPATKFTAEAVYCQSHAAPSCRTWESIASK